MCDRFIELGLSNATALNISGLCMGATWLHWHPGPAMVEVLQQRLLEVAPQCSLEDVRRCLAGLAAICSTQLPACRHTLMFDCSQR